MGANIADGAGGRGAVDFARFLQIALGSASELEYHLLLARDLDLLKSSDYQSLSSEAAEVEKDAGISHAQGES